MRQLAFDLRSRRHGAKIAVDCRALTPACGGNDEAEDPIDLDVDLQDLVDLVSELEGRSETEVEEK